MEPKENENVESGCCADNDETQNEEVVKKKDSELRTDDKTISNNEDNDPDFLPRVVDGKAWECIKCKAEVPPRVQYCRRCFLVSCVCDVPHSSPTTIFQLNRSHSE